jgi:hypothetical protein
LQIPRFQAAFSALPCPVLHRIAFPVVSEWYQSGVRKPWIGAAAFADQIRRVRVRLRRSMSLVSSALPGAAPALRPGTTGFPQAATLSGHSRPSRAVRETGSSTKNSPASIGKLTRTSALGYRSPAIPRARRILCAWTVTSKQEAPSRIRIETLTIADYFLPCPIYYSHRAAI